MKIGQIVDKKIDQSEIESQFIWHQWESSSMITGNTIKKINLSWSEEYSSIHFPSSINYSSIKPIPNNQYCGFIMDRYDLNKFKLLFISNENLNDERYIHEFKNCESLIFCFYDDSIFTFDIGTDEWKTSGYYRAKRYLISQNKWVILQASPLKFASSCTGFNQNIFIDSYENGIPKICVYDIILDSYSFCGPDIKDESKLIIAKNSGKIYLFQFSWYFYQVFTCETLLSDWTLIHRSNKNVEYWIDASYAYHNGSVYYYNDKGLYQFNLSDFNLEYIKE